MRRARIMLVEDNIADKVTIERALEDSRLNCDLENVSNGKEALDKLIEMSELQPIPLLPDLILMDINMPVMDGKQALAAIRQHKNLQHLPVVILTNSNHEKDVMESYQLGVNAYLTKPPENNELLGVIAKLKAFWFELVVLPHQNEQ